MKHPERGAWLLVALGACALGYLTGQAEAGPAGVASAGGSAPPSPGSAPAGVLLAGPAAQRSTQASTPAAPSASSAAAGAASPAPGALPARSEVEPEGAVAAEPQPEPRGSYPVPLALGVGFDPAVADWIARTKDLLGPPPPGQDPSRLPDAWRRLVEAIPVERRDRLLPGLLEAFPELSWDELYYGFGATPDFMLDALGAAWEQARSPAARERLRAALEAADDPRPDLARALALDAPTDLPTLRTLARHDPGRARELLGRLPGRAARELAAGLLEDDEAAAQAYLKLCEEQVSTSILWNVLDRSPRAFAAAARRHRGDPAWASASTLARLTHGLYEDEDSLARRVFAEGWRQLSTDHLLEAVERLDDYEVRPPGHEEAIRRLVTQGTEEQAFEALAYAPAPLCWELYGTLDAASASELACERLEEMVGERPLAVADQLAVFLQQFQRLEGADAVRLATSLADLGDRGAARRVLSRVPAGAQRDFHLRALERNELGRVGWGEEEEADD